MQVIALRDISPNEEASIDHLLEALSLISDRCKILTSYIDTTLPRSLRQAALKETYDFTCQCELCGDDNIIDPRESIWCPKSCGGVCPAPSDGENGRRFTCNIGCSYTAFITESETYQCVKCRAVVATPAFIMDALHIGQEALAKATSIQDTGLSPMLRRQYIHVNLNMFLQIMIRPYS